MSLKQLQDVTIHHDNLDIRVNDIIVDGKMVNPNADFQPGTVYHLTTTAAVSGTVSVTVAQNIRVADVWVVPQGVGGAGDQVIIRNGGTNAITNAISLNGSVDKTTIRATTLDRAHWNFVSGDTLQVEATQATSLPACDVFILIQLTN